LRNTPSPFPSRKGIFILSNPRRSHSRSKLQHAEQGVNSWQGPVPVCKTEISAMFEKLFVTNG
jgi:hypothetical protein